MNILRSSHPTLGGELPMAASTSIRPTVCPRPSGLIYVKAWMFRAHQPLLPELLFKPSQGSPKWWQQLCSRQ